MKFHVLLQIFCHAYIIECLSSKRGLIYITNLDASIWIHPGSDLTWYYTYSPYDVQSYSRSKLQFVPMLWGDPSSSSHNSNLDSSSFFRIVRNYQRSGLNITHVLGFNEPDGVASTGGSNITPERAATIWINEIEPLKELGIKLGAPATQGTQTGIRWLQSFMNSCNGSCTIDFLPVHWYDSFQGFTDYIGQVYVTFGMKPIWVTEFALANVTDLLATQNFLNQSLQYLDNLSYVERYSYFGSFRSSASNIGPNAAMLNSNGQLTEIGSLYLGNVSVGTNASSQAFTNLLTMKQDVKTWWFMLFIQASVIVLISNRLLLDDC